VAASEVVERKAVRAIIMDGAGRVLLVRFERKDVGKAWWAAVGGGLDEGEGEEAALRREIAEETGLLEFEVGPKLWQRQTRFEYKGKDYLQEDWFWLVRVEAFEPTPRWANDEERDLVDEVRWWTVEEMEGSTEVMSPDDLPALVRGLLRDGVDLA
jgi:ADP-ribose pyrophosphatase YjhB (NUDIX family)